MYTFRVVPTLVDGPIIAIVRYAATGMWRAGVCSLTVDASASPPPYRPPPAPACCVLLLYCVVRDLLSSRRVALCVTLGCAVDTALNGVLQSNNVTIHYDVVAPRILITSETPRRASQFSVRPITITFDERVVENVTEKHIVVENANMTSFVMVRRVLCRLDYWSTSTAPLVPCPCPGDCRCRDGTPYTPQHTHAPSPLRRVFTLLLVVTLSPSADGRCSCAVQVENSDGLQYVITVWPVEDLVVVKVRVAADTLHDAAGNGNIHSTVGTFSNDPEDYEFKYKIIVRSFTHVDTCWHVRLGALRV